MLSWLKTRNSLRQSSLFVRLAVCVGLFLYSLPTAMCSCACCGDGHTGFSTTSGCCSNATSGGCCGTASQLESENASCCCSTPADSTGDAGDSEECCQNCECCDDCQCNLDVFLLPAEPRLVINKPIHLPLARLTPIFELKPARNVELPPGLFVVVSSTRVHALCSVWLN